MAVEFILKIDDPNLPIVMRTFGARLEAELPEKILHCLMSRVVCTKQQVAQSQVIPESEIEIDTD
jgi:hypothetical protein